MGTPSDQMNVIDSPVAGLGVDPLEYAKLMRRQIAGNALMNQALTPAEVQQPAQKVGQYYTAARVSPLLGVSKLVAALAANKVMDRNNQDQAKYQAQMMQQMYKNSPQGADGGAGAGNAGPNPNNPYGLPAATMLHMRLTNPVEYAKMIQPTEAMRQAMDARNGSVAGAQQQLTDTADANLAKTHAETVKAGYDTVAPDRTLVNYNDPTKPIFTAPDPNKGMQYGPDGSGGISASEIPNSTNIAAKHAGAITNAQESNKPFEKTGDTGTTTRIMPGNSSYFGGMSGKGVVTNAQTTAGKESQQTGASGGQKYASDLSKDAQGALDVHRTLAEMRNLAKQTNPNVQNNLKGQVGAMMMGMGMDEGQVGHFLGMDPGALTAATKLNAHLAQVSTKMTTSRGTNFDLDTFMKNNPNLMMVPGGFQRVLEFMDKQAGDVMDKQKDFQTFKKNIPENEWEAEHTSHWNDLQREKIKSGATNSRRPLAEILGGASGNP